MVVIVSPKTGGKTQKEMAIIWFGGMVGRTERVKGLPYRGPVI